MQNICGFLAWPPADVDIEKRVFARRQLRALFVGRLCRPLTDALKMMIWRFLPSLRQDARREHMLWNVGRKWAFPDEPSAHDDVVIDMIHDDRELMLAAVANNGWILWRASLSLQRDREVVLTAVSNFGQQLQHAHPSLQMDPAVVLAAVENYGLALEHAHPSLKNDMEVVLTAVSNNGEALRYASRRLSYDEDVQIAAVTCHPTALQWGMDPSRNVVLHAVRRSGDTLQYAPYVIREDKWVVHTAVENDAHALKWALPPALDDMEVVLTAVANCWLALKHVSIRLKYDRKVLRVAATGCRLCDWCAQLRPECLRSKWSE